MRVLIGCEYSGTVRDAFQAQGHEVTYEGIARAKAAQWGAATELERIAA
jgi:hypothetical protein